jgi:hypothetical protein
MLNHSTNCFESTMALTDINIQVSPLVDAAGQAIARPDLAEQNLSTLNYLCAADNALLSPAVPFNWDWVDKSESNDH